MINKKTLIIIAITAGLMLAVFLSWVFYAQSELVIYDPDNCGPTGLKAINLLLEREGYQTSSMRSLVLKNKDLVIMPTNFHFKSDLSKQVLAWVASGGTIVELAQDRPVLHRESLSTVPLFAPELEVKSFHNKMIAADITWLRNLQYHCQNESLYTTLQPPDGFYAIKQHFFIYSYQYGEGRIINWNDPDGLTNATLKKYPNNAVIFAILVERFSKSPRISFLNLNPVVSNQENNRDFQVDWQPYWISILLALVGVCLLLWKIAARFGRPRPLFLAEGRSAAEFVYAMAMLFQQANAQEMVISNLYTSLTKVVAELTCLPLDSSPNVFRTRLVTLLGQKEADRVIEVLELGIKIRNKRLSGRAFLDTATQLDICRKGLIAWKKFKHA
jgi:hypothetical protein